MSIKGRLALDKSVKLDDAILRSFGCPLELATRLVRMFSFHGEKVLELFCGSGVSMLTVMKWNRNSIGIEIDPDYCSMAARMFNENQTLFSSSSFECIHAPAKSDKALALHGRPVSYRVRRSHTRRKAAR